MTTLIVTLILVCIALSLPRIAEHWRRPRCHALYPQEPQRCRLHQGHEGPHYARWQPYGTSGTAFQRKVHWQNPEPASPQRPSP